jgi:hypothetical protein
LQALLPTGNTARLEHAAVLHLTFVSPSFGQQTTALPQRDGHCPVGEAYRLGEAGRSE